MDYVIYNTRDVSVKPLRLSDSELDSVMNACRPPLVHARDAFLQDIADTLRRCDEIGPGAVHRRVSLTESL